MAFGLNMAFLGGGIVRDHRSERGRKPRTCGFAVIGTVRCKLLNLAVDLIQHIRQRGWIANVLCRQFRADDLSAVKIEIEVQLSP